MQGSFEAQPVVFIVDDDTSMRKGLAALLQSVGLRTETFATAAEFLAVKLPDAPCCLILDVRMPGVSGLDVQTKLAALNIDIPIIFVTGHGDIPMSVRAMKAGAIEFLTKPVREQDFLDAVQAALERDKARREQTLGTGDPRPERRLAAILAADVAGYSRLMGADEVGTLAALKAQRRDIVDPAIAAQKGRIVKTTGDGMLVEFASAVGAVTCPVAVQRKMAERAVEKTIRIQYRVGINVGDIIIEAGDIFGDGVNVAVRVENECEPGSVCLSDDAYRQVRGKTAFTFEDLGEKSLKNIDRPVLIYAVRWPTEGSRLSSGVQ